MLQESTANRLSIPVSHYSGCGNDFLLIDNRERLIPELTSEVVAKLCQKECGAGVDGLIIVSSSKSADVCMKYYNCDGFEAEMCGNGVRCLMQYLRQKRSYPRTRCLLETKKRELLISVEANDVAVHMGEVHELGWNIELDYEGKTYCMHHVDTGVAHLVIFVQNLKKIDVERLGHFFRFHERFSPEGANVNFVEQTRTVNQYSAHIRTYERGVEHETLACGTGVTAAAYCLYKLHQFQSPISLCVKSGEWLQVLFEVQDGKLDNIILKGPATWIRDGVIDLDLKSLSFALQFYV